MKILINYRAYLFVAFGLFFFGVGYFLYAEFSTLGDSSWLPLAKSKPFVSAIGNSTDFTIFIYSNLERVIGYWPLAVICSIVTSLLLCSVYLNCADKRSRLLCVIFSLLPLSQIWFNSTGKEVLYLSFLLMIFMLMKQKEARSIGLVQYYILIVPLMYLVFIFKPQYFPVIFSVLAIFYYSKVRVASFNAIVILFLIPLSIIIGSQMIFYIDSVVLEIPQHFSSGGSTRHISEWDGFFGFLLSSFLYFDVILFDVYFSDIVKSKLSFSLFMVSLLDFFYVALCFFFSASASRGFSSKSFLFFLIIYCYLYFSYVPFAIFNPGSALRYGASLYAVLLFISLVKIEFYPGVRKVISRAA